MLKVWQKNLDKFVVKSPEQFKVRKAYSFLLSWVHQNDYKGACHDVSAVLFIVLSEIGYSCQLKIGEMALSTNAVTDHSWVDYNGSIYDIAISKPNYPQHSHPPIFHNNSLDNSSELECYHGVKLEGLGPEAEFVLGSSLIEYCQNHPRGADFVFKLASKTLKGVGLRVSYTKLKDKYSHVTRELVINS